MSQHSNLDMEVGRSQSLALSKNTDGGRNPRIVCKKRTLSRPRHRLACETPPDCRSDVVAPTNIRRWRSGAALCGTAQPNFRIVSAVCTSVLDESDHKLPTSEQHRGNQVIAETLVDPGLSASSTQVTDAHPTADSTPTYG